jgi:hypothetical protein
MGAAIALLVICLGLYTLTTFLSVDDADSKIARAIIYTVATIVFLFLSYGGISYWSRGSYKDGQTDALKGNFKYEEQHIYRLTDSIPTDTIYVKINK